MSESEPKFKPVIGDDGELLEGDTSFPLIGYVDPSEVEVEPPLVQRIGMKLIYPLIVLTLCSMWWLTTNFKPASNGANEAGATQFANHPIYLHTNFQLPEAGSAASWNSDLTNLHSVSWSADQRHLAITYGQKQLAILDIPSNQYAVNKLDVAAFDWSPKNAQQFVAADAQTISIYDNGSTVALHTTLKLPTDFPLPAALVRWSLEGSQIAAVSQDWQTIAVFYAANGDLATEKQFQQPVLDIRWSPVKSLLLAVQADSLIYIQPANSELAQTQQEWTITPENKVSWKTASFAPDGQQAVIAGQQCDARLAVFDKLASSPKWIKQLADYANPNCTRDGDSEIAWSPTKYQIATFIQGDDAVYLWDSNTAVVIDCLIPLRSRPISTIAWSPDGHFLTIVSGSVIVLWSPA